MATNTSAGTPVPTLGDVPNVPADILKLATFLDPVTIPRFASAGAASTAFPSPYTGQMVNISGVVSSWNGTAWVRAGRGLTVQNLATGTLPGYGLGIITPGNTSSVFAANVTVPSQGAYYVEFEVAVPICFGSNITSAGYVNVSIGGVQRQYRFHNGGITPGPINTGGTYRRSGPFAAGLLNCAASVSLDGASGQALGMLETTYTINAICPEV